MPGTRRFRRLLDWVFDFDLKIAMVALLTMMMVVVADVFMRAAFNAPIRGSFDLVGMCLVVMVAFGLPRVIADRLELAIELIDMMVPPPVVRVLSTVAGILSTFVLLFILWSMIKPTVSAYNYGDRSLELNLPVWIIWALALAGMASAAIAALAAALTRQQPAASPPTGGEANFE